MRRHTSTALADTSMKLSRPKASNERLEPAIANANAYQTFGQVPRDGQVFKTQRRRRVPAMHGGAGAIVVHSHGDTFNGAVRNLPYSEPGLAIASPTTGTVSSAVGASGGRSDMTCD